MLSETSSTATNSPNFFVTRSMRTNGFASGFFQGSNLNCVSRADVAMKLRSLNPVRPPRASVARREARPRPVQFTRELGRLAQIRPQFCLDSGRRIDTGVVAQARIQQRRRRL